MRHLHGLFRRGTGRYRNAGHLAQVVTDGLAVIRLLLQQLLDCLHAAANRFGALPDDADRLATILRLGNATCSCSTISSMRCLACWLLT